MVVERARHMGGAVAQHALEPPAYAAGPARLVHPTGQSREVSPGEGLFAELVRLARIGVVAAGRQGHAVPLAQARREDARPLPDPGRGVRGRHLVVRSEGHDPFAVHRDGAALDACRADREDQRRGVNGQHGRIS